MRLFTFVFSLLCVTTVFARQYTVVNSCPQAINLYLGDSFQQVLAVNGAVTQTLADDAGFFYTDANRVSGSTSPGTRAGFLLEPQYRYYYMVIDPLNFNVAMSITPSVPASNGFCPKIECDTATCSTAFTTPPSHLIPPSTPVVPTPPMYSCLDASAAFTVTFCPAGSLPPSSGVAIHPNGDLGRCLDVRGAVFANGTPIQDWACNGTPAQRWIINQGITKVQLAGTNFCLDAGSSPGNGVGMKIWQCYDNLPAQAWYYTNDDRIAVTNQGQCLDLPNGNHNIEGLQVQTWQCTDFNTNQIWTLS